MESWLGLVVRTTESPTNGAWAGACVGRCSIGREVAPNSLSPYCARLSAIIENDPGGPTRGLGAAIVEVYYSVVQCSVIGRTGPAGSDRSRGRPSVSQGL